jgi:predicted NAD/FAD-dependent oxidoreductase
VSGAEAIDVAVVGAGISGLCAANELARSGRRVVLIEKSRGIGGRMATRRLGAAVCDHGAQFFTVRGRAFGGIVGEAHEAGAATVWCHGFARGDHCQAAVVDAADGHPRWRGIQGMTDLPKRLASIAIDRGVRVQTNAKVVSVSTVGGRVRLALDGAEAIEAAAAVLTSPVPQSLDLLAAGAAAIDESARRSLVGIEYDPCFALMILLDRTSLVPSPGAIQFAGGPISWLADNLQKGISPVPALTVHASGAWSRERFDDPPDDVATAMIEMVRPWLGAAEVVERSLQRWKFAQPRAVLPEPLVAVSVAPPIVCCGDAFAGPKVEGAASSGLAAAAWLARVLSGRCGA